MAKFDPLLSLDCAGEEGMRRNPRKGRDQILPSGNHVTRDTHQYFTKPSPVDVGDYLEFLAETDLRVSASTCPQGDVSLACGGGGEPVVYPLRAEVYDLPDGFLTGAGWRPSSVSSYSRDHGIGQPAPSK